MSRFEGAFAKYDAVVRDDPYEVTPNSGVSTGDGVAPFGLKFRVLGAVHHAGNDFSCIEANAIISAHYAVNLSWVIVGRTWLFPVHPVLAVSHAALVCCLTKLAEFAVRLALIAGYVVGNARCVGMYHCAAQCVGLDDLSKRRLDYWWTAQKNATDTVNHNDFIAQGRYVGAAGGAPAEDYRQLG